MTRFRKTNSLDVAITCRINREAGGCNRNGEFSNKTLLIFPFTGQTWINMHSRRIIWCLLKNRLEEESPEVRRSQSRLLKYHVT